MEGENLIRRNPAHQFTVVTELEKARMTNEAADKKDVEPALQDSSDDAKFHLGVKLVLESDMEYLTFAGLSNLLKLSLPGARKVMSRLQDGGVVERDVRSRLGKHTL